MTRRPETDADLEPGAELPALGRELEAGSGEVSQTDLDAMFRAVEARVSQAEAAPTGWLRSRSTPVRRLMALVVFVVVVLLAAVLAPPRGIDVLSMPSALVTAAALALLVFASLFVAMRPLHVPALPRWQLHGLVGLTLAATFVVAVTTSHPVEMPGTVWESASPCMYFGLLAGVPVFAVARLLDRGAVLGPILAAAAAGLAGNVALTLHCPLASTTHNLAGHASVAVLFVVGIGVVELLLRRGRG